MRQNAPARRVPCARPTPSRPVPESIHARAHSERSQTCEAAKSESDDGAGKDAHDRRYRPSFESCAPGHRGSGGNTSNKPQKKSAQRAPAPNPRCPVPEWPAKEPAEAARTRADEGGGNRQLESGIDCALCRCTGGSCSSVTSSSSTPLDGSSRARMTSVRGMHPAQAASSGIASARQTGQLTACASRAQ
jgi:hypothetical protein